VGAVLSVVSFIFVVCRWNPLLSTYDLALPPTSYRCSYCRPYFSSDSHFLHRLYHHIFRIPLIFSRFDVDCLSRQVWHLRHFLFLKELSQVEKNSLDVQCAPFPIPSDQFSGQLIGFVTETTVFVQRIIFVLKECSCS
jgi:hypothetical protein